MSTFVFSLFIAFSLYLAIRSRRGHGKQSVHDFFVASRQFGRQTLAFARLRKLKEELEELEGKCTTAVGTNADVDELTLEVLQKLAHAARDCEMSSLRYGEVDPIPWQIRQALVEVE